MDPVQEQLDAYNARDLERFQACYHPDAVVEDSAGAQLMDGAAALRRCGGGDGGDGGSIGGTDNHNLGDYRLDRSLAGE